MRRYGVWLLGLCLAGSLPAADEGPPPSPGKVLVVLEGSSGFDQASSGPSDYYYYYGSTRYKWEITADRVLPIVEKAIGKSLGGVEVVLGSSAAKAPQDAKKAGCGSIVQLTLTSRKITRDVHYDLSSVLAATCAVYQAVVPKTGGPAQYTLASKSSVDGRGYDMYSYSVNNGFYTLKNNDATKLVGEARRCLLSRLLACTPSGLKTNPQGETGVQVAVSNQSGATIVDVDLLVPGKRKTDDPPGRDPGELVVNLKEEIKPGERKSLFFPVTTRSPSGAFDWTRASISKLRFAK